jgi:hypothetical protein
MSCARSPKSEKRKRCDETIEEDVRNESDMRIKKMNRGGEMREGGAKSGTGKKMKSGAEITTESGIEGGRSTVRGPRVGSRVGLTTINMRSWTGIEGQMVIVTGTTKAPPVTTKDMNLAIHTRIEITIEV